MLLELCPRNNNLTSYLLQLNLTKNVEKKARFIPLQFTVTIEFSPILKRLWPPLGGSISNFSHYVEVHHRGKQISIASILVTAFLYPVFFFCYDHDPATEYTDLAT
jgi:hypothetical protein